MRRKISLLSAAGLVVAVLLLAPGVAGASSGSIAGGTEYENGRVHVDNVSVTMDQCGPGDACEWFGAAWTSSGNLDGNCPVVPELAGSTEPIWGTPLADANGTVQSGPLDFEPFHSGLVCLYLHTTINGFGEQTLLAQKALVFKPTGSTALKKCKKHKHHAASAKKHCKKRKK